MKFLNDGKALAVLLVSVCLAVVLGAGGVALYFSGSLFEKPGESEPSRADSRTSAEESGPSDSDGEAEASGDGETVSSGGGEPSGAESRPEEDPAEPPPASDKAPTDLRAVFIAPGVDFMAGALSAETVRGEIDQALANASAFTANAVVVQTVSGGKPIYQISGVTPAMADFDPLEYICEQAAGLGLAVYATFPVLGVEGADGLQTASQIDSAVLDGIIGGAGEFAGRYPLTGVYLDDYCFSGGGAFASYLENGSGMGYSGYTGAMTTAAVTAAAGAVREAAPGMLVGLYTPAVWANSTSNEAGSATAATFQTLVDGNADTKAWVEQGLVDFIAAEAFGATDDAAVKFSSVVSWWGKLAGEAGIPVYPVHAATKAAGTWTYDELAQQFLEAKDIAGYGGSIFDSLAALVANPKGSTDSLKRAMKDEIDLSYILEKLELTKPSQSAITTADPTYTLMGASDPDYPLTVNGEEVQRNESGYFNIDVTLQEGANTYVFEHKDQKLTYTINHVVEVIKKGSVSPKDNLTLEGGMAVTVSVMAYPDATVTATLSGSTITLKRSEVEEDEESIDSGDSYVRFVGSFPTSKVTADTNLGRITVGAVSARGTQDSAQGASVVLVPKAEIGEGQLVQVTATSAETFPDNVVNDTSVSTYFPICQGAMDYTVSDELEYSNGTKTFSYFLLASGRRVYAKDISVVQGGQDLNGNKVSGMKVGSDGGTTNVTFKTDKPVSYTLTHENGAISIKFHYTTSTPSGGEVSGNPLFSSASWAGSTVTLKLKNAASFIGYTAAYEGSDLVFRFKNSPGGLSGARIFIDAGHSADSVGAMGNFGSMSEYEINRSISEYLKEILEENGARVKLLDNSSYVTLESRMSQAESFNPHVLVSVHSNSAGGNSSARGSEAYYFYNFSSSLAGKAAAQMADALETTNRGAKKGLFYVNRTSEFASILTETGFITNQDEYDMMIRGSYQKRVAAGIAQAVGSYLAGAAGDNSGGGVDWSDDGEDDGEDEEESSSSESSGGAVEGVSVSENKLELAVGETYTLKVYVEPDGADDRVTWKSSKESVATVNANGKITAREAGTATITVTTREGGKTDTCKVTVTEGDAPSGGAVKSLSLSRTRATVKLGEELVLTAKISPEDADDAELTWDSSDWDVAEVEDGVVIACEPGKATITVTTDDGGKKATCEITVTE